MRWSWALAAILASGCGRIGYDEIAFATVDAPPTGCPSDMISVAPGSGVVQLANVCIELTERGTETWVVAKQQCLALGRRLCADAEWYSGCINASGLVDMIDGGYEWVAEEAGGVAQKRGSDSCEVMSSHEIDTDPYEFRCCKDL